MQADFNNYSSFTPVTPSATNLITCRGILVSVSGTVAFQTGIQSGVNGVNGASPQTVTVQCNAGVIEKIALDQGVILPASTATGIVACN